MRNPLRFLKKKKNTHTHTQIHRENDNKNNPKLVSDRTCTNMKIIYMGKDYVSTKSI